MDHSRVQERDSQRWATLQVIKTFLFHWDSSGGVPLDKVTPGALN